MAMALLLLIPLNASFLKTDETGVWVVVPHSWVKREQPKTPLDVGEMAVGKGDVG